MYHKQKTGEFSIVSSIKWEVGAHTQFSKNIYDSLKSSIFLSMNVTQFFMGNPKSFKRHRVTKEDIKLCKQILTRFPLHVFSHFPYVANFAGSVNQLAWAGDLQQDCKTQNIINELEYELNVISNFSGMRNGVVIHPGNYKDRKLGLTTIAKSINKINFIEGSTLLLENAAGQGCSLATTFEEIKEIIDQVEPDKQKHIGVCVDTAHICGYGKYDLSKCSEVKRMFDEFDKIIGIEKFTLLHLNDSVVNCGSRKDEHACLGSGYIWGESFDSLVLILDICKKHGIPAMLETNVLDMFVLGALSEQVNKLKMFKNI
jgi:deoxyribonuclease IV